MVSALDSGSGGPGSSPGQGTALCSWARHFTFIVPLSKKETDPLSCILEFFGWSFPHTRFDNGRLQISDVSTVRPGVRLSEMDGLPVFGEVYKYIFPQSSFFF